MSFIHKEIYPLITPVVVITPVIIAPVIIGKSRFYDENCDGYLSGSSSGHSSPSRSCSSGSCSDND
jgi:hypothetical protein